VTRYYLGIPVEVEPHPEEPGWVWADWPDGRRFKHWSAQLEMTPWGEQGE
jgi:hypothetical protein